MATLSVNEATTFRWTFEEDVAHYVEAGVPAIGVWRQKLSDCGEEKAADLIQERVEVLFRPGDPRDLGPFTREAHSYGAADATTRPSY